VTHKRTWTINGKKFTSQAAMMRYVSGLGKTETIVHKKKVWYANGRRFTSERSMNKYLKAQGGKVRRTYKYGRKTFSSEAAMQKYIRMTRRTTSRRTVVKSKRTYRRARK
jgi:hypothetical protein